MRLKAIHEVCAIATLLAFTFLIAGCAFWADDDGCNEARYERELQALRAEIDAEIGEAEAPSVEMCRALPLGDKPCGGPWEYLVYSTDASNPDRLERLASEYDRIDAERNRACGLASDCAFLEPPPLALRDGRCVAGR